MKQIAAVLDAVNEGCDTSNQVSAVTGLSIKAASTYLTELCRAGLIRRVENDRRKFNDRGPFNHVYRALRPSQ